GRGRRLLGAGGRTGRARADPLPPARARRGPACPALPYVPGHPMNDLLPAAAASADARALPLRHADPEIWRAVDAERQRQMHSIELIASENFVSQAVLDAQGSVMTNKYAEGYPGRRYYGGCRHVDVAEQAAIERARRLFGCAYANVQPHSGSQANQAVYLALLAPGDRIRRLDLKSVWHLTQSARVNLSGQWLQAPYHG